MQLGLAPNPWWDAVVALEQPRKRAAITKTAAEQNLGHVQVTVFKHSSAGVELELGHIPGRCNPKRPLELPDKVSRRHAGGCGDFIQAGRFHKSLVNKVSGAGKATVKGMRSVSSHSGTRINGGKSTLGLESDEKLEKPTKSLRN